MHQNFWNQIYL